MTEEAISIKETGCIPILASKLPSLIIKEQFVVASGRTFNEVFCFCFYSFVFNHFWYIGFNMVYKIYGYAYVCG